jgi:hypothetical protein
MKNSQLILVQEINHFPLTETSNFNRMYIHKDRRGSLKIKSIKRNPNNPRVYFISLFEEDLKNLVDTCFGKDTPITAKDIKKNQFAVYNYQINKLGA